jgi:hypothetical protein
MNVSVPPEEAALKPFEVAVHRNAAGVLPAALYTIPIMLAFRPIAIEVSAIPDCECCHPK